MNCFFLNMKKLLFEKTKQCHVKYQERFYGVNRENFIIQEFFNFDHAQNLPVMNRWFPQTIKQFASFELFFSKKDNPLETILYKNGFFDIRYSKKKIIPIYDWDQEDWNQNIESFFIYTSQISRGGDKYSRITIIKLFKTDGQCLELEFVPKNQKSMTPFTPIAQIRPVHDKTFLMVHSLSPSFFVGIKNNQFCTAPSFQLFGNTNTTSETKKIACRSG